MGGIVDPQWIDHTSMSPDGTDVRGYGVETQCGQSKPTTPPPGSGLPVGQSNSLCSAMRSVVTVDVELIVPHTVVPVPIH